MVLSFSKSFSSAIFPYHSIIKYKIFANPTATPQASNSSKEESLTTTDHKIPLEILGLGRRGKTKFVGLLGHPEKLEVSLTTQRSEKRRGYLGLGIFSLVEPKQLMQTESLVQNFEGAE
ncbi:hypothetical protein CEXT_314631 [Caerostris extrusa]|uniref:Uncharacterized protein n=1 Tax=Caerostris extrusa TaxID=172846 RepID=A0AAV4Q3J8_CAEEX|nr:hypothetical protein CEXT_314631 [Caerostris extrusa]